MLNWWTYGTCKHHLLASFALALYVTKGIKMLTYANVLSAADLFLSSFLCSWGKIKDYENQFMQISKPSIAHASHILYGFISLGDIYIPKHVH